MRALIAFSLPKYSNPAGAARAGLGKLGIYLPTKRATVKFLHWSMIPFFVWFLFANPDALRRMGPRVFQFHSLMGLGFVILSLIWTGMYLRKGLLSRPGPKLPIWARPIHRIMHHTLIWGIFAVAFGGFLLGLTASFLMKAGGILPFAPPLNMPQAHHWIGLIHTYQFYALAGLVAFHATFHVWRHIRLKDNALRIMAPRALHRWL